MDEWLGNSLLVLLGIIITGIVTILTTRLTSSTQKKTAEIEANGPSWASFVQEIRAENKSTKDELNGKIDRLRGQVSDLRDEVQSLRGRFAKAMVHIAAWRRNHPESPLMESLPDDLRDDLPPDFRI